MKQLFNRKYFVADFEKGKGGAGSTSIAGAVSMTIANHETGQPACYLGEAVVLDLTLVNNTGNDIALPIGSVGGAAFDLYFLQLGIILSDCKIVVAGWTMTAGKNSLALKYTAGAAGIWSQGTANALTFQITGVQSNLQQAVSGFFQLNFINLSSGGSPIPRSKTPLALIQPPLANNALPILPNLEAGGIIYVSDPTGNLLENILFLTITNTGANAIYNGSLVNQGKPSFSVSFVYGTTPGSLAPDISESDPNSAWLIKSKLAISEGKNNDWTPSDPEPGVGGDPVWLITPESTNLHLLGTGDAASLTFSFNHIVSQTDPGTTLMTLVAAGFKKDDDHLYNEQVFVLPIIKQELPAPGLLRFASMRSEIHVTSIDQKLTVPLVWSMTGVSKIVLQFWSDEILNLNIPDVTIRYPSPQPVLQYGTYNLEFSGVSVSGSLLITATPYINGNKNPGLEYTVAFDFPPVVTCYRGDIQSDGTVLLQWKTQGATKVLIGSNFYAPSGLQSIQRDPSSALLLNNIYYALIAQGPNKTSDPCVFKFGRRVFTPVGSIEHSGGYPIDITASPDNKYALIGNEEYPMTVIDLSGDPPSQLLPYTIEIPTIDAQTIAFTPDGKYAFLPNGPDPNNPLSTPTTVSVIQLTGSPPFQLLPAITVGPFPSSITISPDGHYLFVTLAGNNSLAVIDVSKDPTFVVLSPTIATGAVPGGIAITPNGKYLFVINQTDETISVFDTSKPFPFTQVSTITGLSDLGSCIRVSPNGNWLFVNSNLGNTVLVFDLRTGPPFQAVSPAITTAQYPGALAFSPDGDYLYILCTMGSTLIILDISSAPPFQNAITPLAVNYAATDITMMANGNYLLISSDSGPHNSTFILGPSSASAFENWDCK